MKMHWNGYLELDNTVFFLDLACYSEFLQFALVVYLAVMLWAISHPMKHLPLVEQTV